MANKKISELNTRTPSLTDLMLVGDPSTGYSYKATLSALSTLLEANISLNDLNDVTITSPTAGQVLSYNGTAWVNDTNGITGSGTTNYVPKFTSSSAIGNSQIFDNGTSVGIATATPSAAYRLDIEGNVRVGSGQILAFSNFNNTNTYQVYNVGGSGAGGEILVFTNGTTERMRLDASGNLIVGGTSALLSASGRGNITLNGSTDAIFTFGNAGAYSGYLYSSSAKFEIDAQGARYMQFNTNGSERMRLDASGRLLIGTTNGVGTDFVSVKFNSSTTYSQGLNMVDANASSNGGIFQVFRKSDDTFLGLIRRNSTDDAVLVSGNSYLALGSGNTEKARLDASGNLGLGTTSPNALLHLVSATTRQIIESTTNSQNAGLYFTTKNASSTVQQGGMYYIPGTTPYLTLTGDNTNTHLNVTSGGNVGIGTTNPTFKLQVIDGTLFVGESSGSGNNQMGRISFGSTGIGGGYTNYGGQIASYSGSGIDVSDLRFYTGNGSVATERMRITSGGELLINTTSDAGDYKLQVNGSQSLNGILDLFDFIGATTNKWNLYHYNDNTFRMNYNGSGSDELILSTGGNLELTGSIKTAAPSGGTAQAWKLGTVASVSPTSPNRTIEVEVNGTTYYLHAKTTND